MISLVAKGYSNKEIAEALFLSEGTVRNYLSAILDKLGSGTGPSSPCFILTTSRRPRERATTEKEWSFPMSKIGIIYASVHHENTKSFSRALPKVSQWTY